MQNSNSTIRPKYIIYCTKMSQVYYYYNNILTLFIIILILYSKHNKLYSFFPSLYLETSGKIMLGDHTMVLINDIQSQG